MTEALLIVLEDKNLISFICRLWASIFRWGSIIIPVDF